MNISQFTTVKKFKRIKNKHYVYLYEMLPNKAWAVVVYGSDDDTMVASQYFQVWKLALRAYNIKVQELMEE